MTSSVLFLNSIRENLKRRLWVFWLALIGQAFLYPVSAMLAIHSSALDAGPQPTAQDLYHIRELYHTLFGVCGFQQFLFLLAGAFLACQGFGFLMNKSKVDFYHSVPVSRGVRFAVITVNSLLIYLVTHLSMLALGLLSAALFLPKGLPGNVFIPGLAADLLLSEALNLLALLSGYVTGVLAVMLTGHILVAVAGGLVLALYEPFANLLLDLDMGLFFRHYYVVNQSFSDFWYGYGLTPTALVSRQIVSFASEQYYIGEIGGGYGYTWDPALGRVAVSPAILAQKLSLTVPSFLWLLLLIALYFALCVFLYRMRPSEAAGRAMAFAPTKPVIKTAILVFAGMAGGSFFYGVTGHSTGFLIFGTALGLLLGHLAVEMIYEWDIRAWGKHFISVGVSAVICAVLFGCLIFDLTGFDRYVPAEANVESAAFYLQNGSTCEFYDLDGEEGYVGGEELVLRQMHVTNVSPILIIARNNLENSEDTPKNGYCVVCYHLKNGRDVYRSVYVDYNADEDAWDELVKDTEYLSGSCQLYSEEFRNRVPEMLIGVLDWNGEPADLLPDIRQQMLTGEKALRLYNAYAKEYANRSFAQIRDEAPVFELEMRQYYGPRSENYNSWTYPVYQDFTETMEVLKRSGIEPKLTLLPEEVKEITVDGPGVYALSGDAQEDGEDSSYSWESRTYADPDEIREILPYVTIRDLERYRLIWQEGSDYSATVELREKGSRELYCGFAKGKLPECVKESFQ